MYLFEVAILRLRVIHEACRAGTDPRSVLQHPPPHFLDKLTNLPQFQLPRLL